MNTCILFHYEIITHLHAISVFCNDVWATGLEIKRNKHSFIHPHRGAEVLSHLDPHSSASELW